MPSVLFVCTANRFRSPLAAALFTNVLKDMGIANDWRVGSAGTWAIPRQPTLPRVLSVSRRFGIDLSTHSSMPVSRKLLTEYDLILVMQASHREALMTEFPDLKERIFLLSDVVEARSYDISDSLQSEEGILDVLTVLQDLLSHGGASICDLASKLHHKRHHAKSMDE